MTTINYPHDLQNALNDYVTILPGSNLLLDGFFSGNYSSTLPSATVKPLNNSSIIDGSLSIYGDSVVFRDLEITFAGWTTRQSTDANGAGIPLEKSVNIYAPNCKFINCDIHDMVGVGFWLQSTASEFYGNNVYGIGWLGTDRGHGHAIYTQNKAGAKKTYKHNFFHNCFGWNFHAYSSAGTNLQDMDIIENISFNSGSLSGSPRPNILIGAESGKASNILLDGNCTYGGALGIGFYGAGAENVTIQNHYGPDGIGGVYTAVETGNHYGPSIGDTVRVFQNEYNPNRLHIAIYNEAGSDVISVDVSAYFQNNDEVRIINVQDCHNDRILTTVKDGAINIPMTGRTVFTPVAWQSPASTFPDFGAFIVERL